MCLCVCVCVCVCVSYCISYLVIYVCYVCRYCRIVWQYFCVWAEDIYYFYIRGRNHGGINSSNNGICLSSFRRVLKEDVFIFIFGGIMEGMTTYDDTFGRYDDI